MAHVRHKVHVDLRSYASPAIAQRFSELVNVLPAHETLQTGNLSVLVGRIIQTNDELFGIRSSKPRAITKLPMIAFHNYTSTGHLFHILRIFFKHIGTYTFSETPKERLISLFIEIEQVLIEKELLIFPCIYLSPSLGATKSAECAQIIQTHKGTLVANEIQATHKIIPKTKSVDMNHDYVRVKQSKGEYSFIHRWNYPDSYDAWVPSRSIAGKSNEVTLKHEGPWEISVEWVEGLELFNEYMFEKDYELTSITCIKCYQNPSLPIGIKRELPIQQNPSKRAAISIANKPMIRETYAQIPVNVVHPESDFSMRSNTTFLNISQKFGLDICRSNILEESEEIGICHWFDSNSIHTVEKRLLHDFFTQGNDHYISDEKYMSIRNEMIALHEKTPLTYLSVSSTVPYCPDIPIYTLTKLHAFLEQWDLINRQTNPDLFITSIPTYNDDEEGKKSVIYQSKRAETLEELLPAPTVFRKIFAFCKECDRSCATNRWRNELHFYDLCDACYSDGKFTTDHDASQFTHVEAPLISLDSDWSTEEILLLLTSIWKHKDRIDWTVIAEEIQHRSPQECILQFVRLPTQEAFLESPLLSWEKKDIQKEGEEGMVDAFDVEAEEVQQFPFTFTSNPVMSFIYYLTSHEYEDLASAAAEAAKEALGSMDATTPVDNMQLYKAALRGALCNAEEQIIELNHKIETNVNEAIRATFTKIEKKMLLLRQCEEKIKQDRKNTLC